MTGLGALLGLGRLGALDGLGGLWALDRLGPVWDLHRRGRVSVLDLVGRLLPEEKQGGYWARVCLWRVAALDWFSRYGVDDVLVCPGHVCVICRWHH